MLVIRQFLRDVVASGNINTYRDHKDWFMELLMVADNDPIAGPVLARELQEYFDWESREYRAGRLGKSARVDNSS